MLLRKKTLVKPDRVVKMKGGANKWLLFYLPITVVLRIANRCLVLSIIYFVGKINKNPKITQYTSFNLFTCEPICTYFLQLLLLFISMTLTWKNLRATKITILYRLKENTFFLLLLSKRTQLKKILVVLKYIEECIWSWRQ